MNTQSQRLAADVRLLVYDAEDLVRATAQETGDKVVELRRRMQQAMDDVKPQLAALEASMSEKATSAVTCTDTYVRDHPWAAMGVSACIGLVMGLLIRRD